MKHLSSIVSVCIALLFAEQSSAALFAQLNNPQDNVLRFAVEFRHAVVGRDTAYLSRLLSNAGGFDAEVMKFVYDDTYVQQFRGPQAKSVASILSSDHLGIIYEGSLETSNKTYEGNVYVLFFYEPVDTQLDQMSIAYLSRTKRWMVNYVACRVERIGTRWMMLDSFCYNETDGP